MTARPPIPLHRGPHGCGLTAQEEANTMDRFTLDRTAPAVHFHDAHQRGQQQRALAVEIATVTRAVRAEDQYADLLSARAMLACLALGGVILTIGPALLRWWAS